jgi:hypothetical protein
MEAAGWRFSLGRFALARTDTHRRLMSHAHHGVQLIFEVFDPLGLSDDKAFEVTQAFFDTFGHFGLSAIGQADMGREGEAAVKSFVHLHDH